MPTSNSEQSFEDGESVGSLGLLVHLDLVPGPLTRPVVPQHYLTLYVLLLLVVGVGGGPAHHIISSDHRPHHTTPHHPPVDRLRRCLRSLLVLLVAGADLEGDDLNVPPGLPSLLTLVGLLQDGDDSVR